MSWLRLHDGFHDEPAIDRVGNEAAGAYVRCASYCADKGTDGFISSKRALVIAQRRVYNRLEAEGLMVPVIAGETRTIEERRDSGRRPLPDVQVTMPEDGWFIPKYLRYNFSREELFDKRKRRSPESTGESTSVQSPESTVAVAIPDPTRPVRAKGGTPTKDVGLPFSTDLAATRLIHAMGPMDENALGRTRSLCLRVSEGSIAKVTESLNAKSPRNRIGYALKALESEANGAAA